MDPLSLTADILAVTGAAKAAAQGLQKLRYYRKAPQAIGELISEITEIQAFLEGVGNVAEYFQNSRCAQHVHNLAEQVGKAGRKIDELRCLLDSSFFQLSRLSNENKARVTWLQHKNEANRSRLRDELRAIRVDLGVTLGLLTM